VLERRNAIKILLFAVLIFLPLFWSWIPFVFLLRLPSEPSGGIQQIFPSGEIKEWKVEGGSEAGLNFRLTSGTMERRFSIYPNQEGIFAVKSATFTTDIGTNNTRLDCLPFQGSMWRIKQGTFLLKRRFRSYYFGKIAIQCTDPFQPEVRIKGDISFERIRR